MREKTELRIIKIFLGIVFLILAVSYTGCRNNFMSTVEVDPEYQDLAVADLLNFGSIQWRVLEIRDDQALLLSESVLEKRRFDADSNDWAESDIRKYLNRDFFEQTFDDEEKAQIQEVALQNEGNDWFDIPGGKDTRDRVFLLSAGEMVKYFGDSGQLSGEKDHNRFSLDDDYSGRRIATMDGETERYWLRSLGSNDSFAVSVLRCGAIEMGGFFVDQEFGLRPAIVITLNKNTFFGGI